MANRKLGKVWNLGNLGKMIPSFLISEFSILPYSQNRKLGFKDLRKKFRHFRDSRFFQIWVLIGKYSKAWNSKLQDGSVKSTDFERDVIMLVEISDPIAIERHRKDTPEEIQ